MTSRPKVAVVGARRSRQGIGEAVAGHFAAQGCDVVAVVGTTAETLLQARENLRDRHGIECAGYLDLRALIERERPDIVAICAPASAHRALLSIAMEAGVHVLCDKPLWWEEGIDHSAEAGRFAAGFAARGRHLALNAQWPATLACFKELHPDVDLSAVRSFSMRLSPTSFGPDMVIDSASHVVSMLQALVGNGRVERVAASYGDRDKSQLSMRWAYAHARGIVDVDAEFVRCAEAPRPASYAINGAWMHRRIRMPAYEISFSAGERAASCGDPMRRIVADFLGAVGSAKPADAESLRNGMEALAALVAAARLPAAEGGASPDIHDFVGKLRQPSLLPGVKAYVRWQSQLRRGVDLAAAPPPDRAPISINLDLTTACNYACDHCVDMPNLNTGVKHDDRCLSGSLALMARRGLKSVIVIGGGEPTVHPRFPETIRLLKALGLQIGIVSNGSGMARVAGIAGCLAARDWIRLSLDAGSDGVFQAMHKPKRAMTLQGICAGVADVKRANPDVSVGFSFVITWEGAFGNDSAIVSNLAEMRQAAELAKRSGFDYISFKPFLTRCPETSAEYIALRESPDHLRLVMERIRDGIERARRLEGAGFRVVVSTNLRVLLEGTQGDYARQPGSCHMTYLRQVLSPLGLFNCPVYRNSGKARIGTSAAYADEAAFARTLADASRNIRSFDASVECAKVTCLYNRANWWLENLIEHPEELDSLAPTVERGDYFL